MLLRLLWLLALAAAAPADAPIHADDADAAAGAAAAAPPVEQFGNALIPTPDSLSAPPSVTVRVDFPRPFKPGTAPLVVATPYFRRLDAHHRRRRQRQRQAAVVGAAAAAGRRVPDDDDPDNDDDELPPLLFAASTVRVEATGFELHVERLDDRLPWRDAMVLVSWIGAWGLLGFGFGL